MLQAVTSDTNGKRLTIHREFGADHDVVVADAARLQQVFWNLLRNATKFTPQGGTLSIRTRNVAGAAARLCIEFVDTGVGIAAEHLPKLFDAFEQAGQAATGQAGGLGLGLAIAKAVVDLHGGTIAAASDGPGRGAVFTVLLDVAEAAPRSAQSAGAGTPRAATGAAAPVARRRRVLLVEDHADTANVLARLLGSSGYDVCTAGCVADALATAATRPFDVLISDIGLPDASGYELMAQIRERYGTTGIALSGYGMEDDVRRGQAAGFAAHVAKPVDLPRLMAIIEQVVPAT